MSPSSSTRAVRAPRCHPRPTTRTGRFCCRCFVVVSPHPSTSAGARALGLRRTCEFRERGRTNTRADQARHGVAGKAEPGHASAHSDAQGLPGGSRPCGRPPSRAALETPDEVVLAHADGGVVIRRSQRSSARASAPRAPMGIRARAHVLDALRLVARAREVEGFAFSDLPGSGRSCAAERVAGRQQTTRGARNTARAAASRRGLRADRVSPFRCARDAPARRSRRACRCAVRSRVGVEGHGLPRTRFSQPLQRRRARRHWPCEIASIPRADQPRTERPRALAIRRSVRDRRRPVLLAQERKSLERTAAVHRALLEGGSRVDNASRASTRRPPVLRPSLLSRTVVPSKSLMACAGLQRAQSNRRLPAARSAPGLTACDAARSRSWPAPPAVEHTVGGAGLTRTHASPSFPPRPADGRSIPGWCSSCSDRRLLRGEGARQERNADELNAASHPRRVARSSSVKGATIPTHTIVESERSFASSLARSGRHGASREK